MVVLNANCEVIFKQTAISADLGDSSKYSSEFHFIILLKTEVEKGSITTVIDYGLDGPKFKSLILFEKGRFNFLPEDERETG